MCICANDSVGIVKGGDESMHHFWLVAWQGDQLSQRESPNGLSDAEVSCCLALIGNKLY